MNKTPQIVKIYPLSPMQEGMIYHHLLGINPQAFFAQSSFNLHGELNLEIMEQSLNFLIARYDTFRTNFVFQQIEHPRQIVLKERHSTVYYEDISELDPDIQQSYIDEFIMKDRLKGFDLTKDVLIRISILQIDPETYKLIWGFHHIILDGWCMGIISKELFQIYEALIKGKTPVLHPVPPFSKFIEWLQTQDKTGGLLFWEKYLEGYEQPAVLMKSEPTVETSPKFQLKRVNWVIDEELVKGIKTITNYLQVTLNAIFLVIWGLLLQKYNNINDVVFGTVVSGRPPEIPEIEKMVGLFINTIPMRIKCDDWSTFADLVRKIHEFAISSKKYDYLSLAEVQSRSCLKRDLIDHLVAFENLPEDNEMEGDLFQNLGLKITNSEVYQPSNYDFTLIIVPGKKLMVEFAFNNYVYSQEFIEIVQGHLSELLKQVVANPEIPINRLEILTEAEKQQFIYDLNCTKVGYPSDQPVHRLFEAQVARTPNHIAATYESKTLTYQELNRRSNQLARLLKSRGVNSGSIVGLMVENSLETIIGMMGILKAGGAYLPIDPDYPAGRIKYLLEDSQINLLLTQNRLIDRVSFAGTIIDLEREELYQGDIEDLEGLAGELAYIIYTSGSTGTPKGVMVTQRGLVNYLWWARKIYINGENLDFPLYSSISFDLTVTSIYTPLISGNKIVVYYDEDKALLIRRILIEDQADIIKLTPTHLNLLEGIDLKPKRLKKLIVGGEDLKARLAEKVYRSFDGKVEIYNEYGPTETVVGCMIYRFDPLNDRRNSVPIGVPADNVQIYLLNRNLQPVPVGVTGEIFISGDGLACGYLNRPELTAEKFINNPFWNTAEVKSNETNFESFHPSNFKLQTSRMYRTGDLGRRLPNGELEFAGRADNQVKIRGYRIEPGEIEARMLQYEAVKDAAVIVRDETAAAGEDSSAEARQYLCAYYITDQELPISQLREYLGAGLPEYMIPEHFVQLETMPLTVNGKIDRKALPEPNQWVNTGKEYVAPVNETEAKLIKIWQEVLRIEKIGTEDNFFELGGHSLKATILINRIYKEMNVEVPLGEIFKTPTIKELAGYIMDANKNIYTSITPVGEKEYYPLSSAQKRLYFLNQFEGMSTSYNTYGVLNVEGGLKRERLETVFKELINRHEALRTSFIVVAETPVQRVHDQVEFALEYTEVEDGNDTRIQSLVESFIRPFDLSKAPLLRVGLIKRSENSYVLIFDMHHIITDGISMTIMEQDFIRLYNGEELPELRLQYKDFSEWQNELFKNDAVLEQEKYWLERFQGELPILNLPTDYPRPPVQSFEGAQIGFQANSELTKKLRNLASGTEATIYMILLAAYNVLLFKYTNQEDIIIGSPIVDRPHPDLENIIGMFVNTLAMRNYPRKNQTFRDFLMTVKETAIAAYENQDYQFEELVEKLKLQRDLSRNPLFDTMFTLIDFDHQPISIPGLQFIPYQCENTKSKFDLILHLVIEEEQINFYLEYCIKLFSKETIERFSQHYLNILQQITKNPEIRLDTLEILSESEKHQLLADFNSTSYAYPRSKTLMDLFEEQAAQNPEKKAAIFDTTEFTYRELNNKANKMAKILREKGVKANDIVAIMTERSPEMLIGLLGILKTGGAYLPVDPAYPPVRINYYLSDSGARFLLRQHQFNLENNFSGEIIDIDQVKFDEENTSNPEKINTSHDLAYVIYTSGSTGQPKGAMIEQHSVVNRLQWMQRMYPLNDPDVILQKTTFTFDVSVWELFWWALVGAKVCFLKPGGEKDPESIIAAIIKHQVTVIHFVPSMLSVFLEYLEQQMDQNKPISLRQVFTSGEALKVQHVERFNQLLNGPYQTKLTNLYGPTEATVDVTYFDCPSGTEFDKVPIGKPIDNTSLYIINESNQLQPIGVPGELCILGVGLAKGYLNRPELTVEKFIPNPFFDFTLQTSNFTLPVMYRTGDLARWLPDGNIEFLGRIDRQVKIRGFRIELGEIEKQLLAYEPVKDAVVLIREDKTGDKYLAAYYTSGHAIGVMELRSYLAEHLPEYMIPSFFVQLEKMPLTANNKIDTKALPDLESNINTSVSPAPMNEIEIKLEEIWREVLNFERIGVNDDFFELGGHSLKATVLVNKIHKKFDVEVPLGEIFKMPTIKGLANYINSAVKNIYESIEPVLEKEYYTISSSQKRLFILHQFEQVSTAYNISAVLLVEGALDRNRLENVFNNLIQRHDAFRTSFELINGEPVQRVHQEVDFKIDFIELPVDIFKIEDFPIYETAKDFIQPFDLSKAPLFRVMIVKAADNKHILLWDMHHIITDELSMNILTRELANLYNGQELPKLRLQYKDFSQWQNNMLQAEVIKKQEQYWLERFQGDITVLNLPTDYPRPVVQSFDGNGINFEAGETLTRNLNELALNTGTTLFMILLATYNVLLFKYTGQEDIIVGSPIAGRPHPDLENIIGMFVNTLAMRNYPQPDNTFRDFLMTVKETAITAYENQDYQFEELVEKLKLRRDLSRNPLFDTMFSFHNVDGNPNVIQGLQFIPYPVKNHKCIFDLTLHAIAGEAQFSFYLEYCTKLFSEETIRRFSQHYLNVLQQITENPEIRLAAVEILSEPERQQILVDFNKTGTEYPTSKTLMDLFEAQADQNPGKQAAIFETVAFTYQELNNKANQLAKILREKGVQANDIVAVMVERSPEMIIGLMGILKAGGAYLPIDPGHPQARIKYCLSDSGARLLLRGPQFNTDIDFDGEIINLEHAKLNEDDTPNPEKINTSYHRAYVIYTSGSTGNPKGTLIEHHSVVNRLHWMQRRYPLTDSDIILQKTTFTFDVSVWELFWWAIQGAKVCFLKPGGEKDPEVIMDTIAQYQVTVIHFVPSMLLVFLESLKQKDNRERVSSLRQVFASGEALKTQQVELFNQLLNDPYQTRLTNLYGPTEATVDVTYFDCPNGVKPDKIPIGKPIDNISMLIINKNNQLQPLGVPGELCISGVGLAEGYLNRPELTAEKFTPNPFYIVDSAQFTVDSQNQSVDSQLNNSSQLLTSDLQLSTVNSQLSTDRIYRTGDLARWLPDGNIEFLGRMDYQVKIRGFRVELEEVEAQLLKFPLINEVIVLDKEDRNGNMYLCAFIISPQELSITELRAYLAKVLPDYLIPSFFIQLEEVPLTVNGKIDKAKLRALQGVTNPLSEYIAPSGEVEEIVVKIWQEVLGIERVGVNQNFFDLGGNSLLVIKLSESLESAFNQDIPLTDLFTYPTISLFRDFLERKKTEEPLFGEDNLAQVDERAKMQQEAIRRRKTALEGRYKTDEQ